MRNSATPKGLVRDSLEKVKCTQLTNLTTVKSKRGCVECNPEVNTFYRHHLLLRIHIVRTLHESFCYCIGSKSENNIDNAFGLFKLSS